MMLYVFLLNLGSSLCSFISDVAAGVLWADKRKIIFSGGAEMYHLILLYIRV